MDSILFPPIRSEISTANPSPFNTIFELRQRQKQRQGSITSVSPRSTLPQMENESCAMSSQKATEGCIGDLSRRRPVSMYSTTGLGGGNIDNSHLAIRTERRTSTGIGMGLREQEQHMVKIGRENWALKLDVTLLQKKRDELGTMTDKLKRQVEVLSRENRELKRQLKRKTEELEKRDRELEKRDRELDEACRMYERLGQTKAVLEELSKAQYQQEQQHVHQQQQSPFEGHIMCGPLSPGMKTSDIGVYSSPKSSECASQAPEFLGPAVRASGRASPSPSIGSVSSDCTGRSRGGFQAPISNNPVQGLPYLASPSVSTCCSLRRIPRHIASDDEDDDDESSSSGDEITTLTSDDGSEKGSYRTDTDSIYSLKSTRPPTHPIQPVTPKVNIANITPPTSMSPTYKKRTKSNREKRVLKFNREEEPDSSDYSSDDEDMFDSDIADSTTHTLTPMTASPEPNRAYLVAPGVGGGGGGSAKPRPLAKKISYVGSRGLGPIKENSKTIATTTNTPSLAFQHLPDDDSANLAHYQHLNDSRPSSVIYSKPDRKIQTKIPVPVPSTASVVARRRRHLDSVARLVMAKEVMTRKVKA